MSLANPFETAAAQFVGYPDLETFAVGTATHLVPPEGPSLLGRWHETRGGCLRQMLEAPPRPAPV